MASHGHSLTPSIADHRAVVVNAGDGGVGDAEAPLGAATSSLRCFLNAPDGAIHYAVVRRGRRRRTRDGHVIVGAKTAENLRRPLGTPVNTNTDDAIQLLVLPYVDEKMLGCGQRVSDFRRTPYTFAHRETLSTATYMHRLLRMEVIGGPHNLRWTRPPGLAVRFSGPSQHDRRHPLHSHPIRIGLQHPGESNALLFGCVSQEGFVGMGKGTVEAVDVDSIFSGTDGGGGFPRTKRSKTQVETMRNLSI